MGRFFDVVVILGVELFLLRAIAKVENVPLVAILMSAGGIAGAAALRPRKTIAALVSVTQLRFRLKTAFAVIAAICAVLALAPELRDYLIVFFVTFFSLVIIGRTLIR